LEIDAVREWWKQNKNETKYQSPYKHYLEALKYMASGINTGNAQQFILLLDETIKLEPNALHARCLRGYIMIFSGKYDKAEEAFNEVEVVCKDYRWLLLYKSLLFACKNEMNRAVNLLNQALTKSPSIKAQAKTCAEIFPKYKEVIENENVKWFSNKQ
jgi:tetratricopeptide (TPR) repeat protein